MFNMDAYLLSCNNDSVCQTFYDLIYSTVPPIGRTLRRPLHRTFHVDLDVFNLEGFFLPTAYYAVDHSRFREDLSLQL